MRIVYVTACLPFGPVEAFLVDELDQLLRSHQVLIVPRSPGKPGPHGTGLLPHTMPEGILSPAVLITAARVFLHMPRRTLMSLHCLLQSPSPETFLRNLVVVPKALWLAHVAAQWRADHIHCHWAGTTATMTLIASRISGIPWSLTSHRSDIVSNNLLREKARSATVVRAISQDGAKMLRERGVEENGKLHVLPMGVVIPEGCNFTLPSNPVVLCPADLLEVKGHRYLLQAWRLLQDRGVHGELWLAGEGELRPALQLLAEKLAITSTVRFMGLIPHAILLQLYASQLVSAVALSSIDLGYGCHEGIPVSLVEAMSYGIPVIATSTGGIPELIASGTGLLVPPCDPVALADAMNQILASTTFAVDVGQHGRQHIIQTRDVVSIVAILESYFRDSLKESTSALDSSSEVFV